ncbi:hypothetical protein J7E38_15895 [Bacillus sp. ISL-35]|uniref:hypothetical protein n=1 Tax=Bacillus sp. ISL-35 TaxID=2819122 RepID=UPI001BEA9368|nr:hypothetical protein [Bacillus sp. ISL-35]MBT2680493.1 hypothetical protein [Bacillus sp. ISL-35]MBT2704214.1 hypothetical protein [Chryseobacterium sp. ISL-80]
MVKKVYIKLSSLLLAILVIFAVVTPASANVFITNFGGTTTPSTTSVPSNYHHFYSMKEGVSVKFKVDEFIQTAGKQGVVVKLQRDNGLWWSTKVSKTVTSTSQVTLNSSAGSGDWRIVVTEVSVPTGYDKPPLYRAKSTRYSGTVEGY